MTNVRDEAWEKADLTVDYGPFTMEEMLEFISENLKDRTPYILVRVSLSVPDSVREISSSSIVPVTRDAAVRHVTDTMRWAAKYNVRMKASMSSRCMFIG